MTTDVVRMYALYISVYVPVYALIKKMWRVVKEGDWDGGDLTPESQGGEN